MTTSTAEHAGSIQSVRRALQILQLVADEPVRVGEVAQVLEVHKSTASRLVATLVTEGFLTGTDSGELRLGSQVARLGRIAEGGADLAETATPVMQRLALETGETVTLSVRDGDYAVTIAQCGGTHRVGVQSWVGARTPLAHTADGKVLLAFAGEPVRGRSLRAELDRVRRAEWATASGELEENLHGVAVPVLDDEGRCRAALCVSGPSYRVTTERFGVLADQVRHAAFQISDRRQQHWEHPA